jgi:hypothetical protein
VTHRDASKKGWSASEAPNITEINMGSFQRIADAAEKMAANYANLLNDRDLYYKWWKEEQDRRRGLERKNNALRGVITKLKKRQPKTWEEIAQ